MEKIIAHIIKNKIPCYFLSPHLDDAVLSAGGLISSLSGNTSVTVVNIFTTAGEKNTLSAKKSIQKAIIDTKDKGDFIKSFSDIIRSKIVCYVGPSF
jgi:hypothetical protein